MLQEQELQLLQTLEESGENWRAQVSVDRVNGRVKIRQYEVESSSGLAALGEYLLSVARENGCGKILAEVRESDWEGFLGRGFAPEGVIPGYFAGEPAYCLSYFVGPIRQHSSRLEKENHILEQVLRQEPRDRSQSPLAGRFQLLAATPDDAEELAELYRKVFVTYPTPLHQPRFVRQLIESAEGVFWLVRSGRRLVSAAAAEVDWTNRNAEMTDCATLPEYRGNGLMESILQALEADMVDRHIPCHFSLARASSHGMNLVLRRLGYRFRGRLINNCHIMGDFEDMNIWVKQH